MFTIKITDPTKPGTVTITATVGGSTRGANNCDEDYNTNCVTGTWTAVGTIHYDPNNQCSFCQSPSSTPSAGSGSGNINSVDFRWNLGQSSSVQRNAGLLWLDAETPSPDLARPVSLQLPFYNFNTGVITNQDGTVAQYLNDPNVEVITNLDGTIAQIHAPQALVNVRVLSDCEYHLEYFYATDVGPKDGNGLYTTNAPAFVTWVVRNPDGNTATNRLWITEQRDGVNRQFQYTYNPVNSEWDLLEPDGQTTLSGWKIPNPNDATITNCYRQYSIGGQVVSQNCKTYQYIPSTGDKLLLQEVNGAGASAQTNIYTYYQTNIYGDYDYEACSNLLQEVVYANGNWAYNIYDEYGRKTIEYTAYNNSPPPNLSEPDPNIIHCKQTRYTYTDTIDYETYDPWKPLETLQYIAVFNGNSWGWQQVASASDFKGNLDSVSIPNLIETITQYINPNGDNNYLETIIRTIPEGCYIGRPILIAHPDGTITTYSYPDQFTTIESDPDGTVTTNIVDELGNPLSIIRVDTNTGVVLSRQIYTYTDAAGIYYDPLRRSHDVTDLAGRTTQYRYSDCCGLSSSTDPDGATTAYTKDALNRQVAGTVYYGASNGITTTNALDAAGRVLSTRRIGADGTTITLNQFQYDLAGRVISQTNALGGVTTTAYGMVNNQLCVTSTDPDGGTRIETYYRDGRLQSVTGTAVHPVQYNYGVEQDNNVWREYTQEIKLTATGGTNEWTKTYVDGIGRPYKTVYSAASPPYPYSQSFYNNQGQLWEQRDPDGVTNFYVYDNTQGDFNQGQRQFSITALSSTALGITDYGTLVSSLTSLEGGIDRVTRVTNTVVPAANGQPNLVRRDTYAWTNNETDGAGTLISSTETSTDGLQTWNIVYRDTSTGVTNSTVTSPGSSRTEIAVAPDNSYTIGTYSYGRLASSARYDASGTNQIAGATFNYDAQGRQYTITDARNGTTTNGYNNADLVTSVTTPNPGGPGGSPQTTVTYYNPMLQATNVTQPDGSSVTSLFLLTGELGLQYGSRTYPVGYSYDYAGRLNTMTNWSNFSGGSGARVTTWNYDAYRGSLTNKTYDGGTNGPSYTYTAAGRPASRTWARGNNTTYNYDHAGGLATVVYSGGLPNVTNTYDRLGRLTRQSTLNYQQNSAYNLAGELLSDSWSGGPLNGLSVTNGYDQYLRRTNLSLLNSSSAILASTAYGYDPASRLATVSDGNNDLAAYIYLANSPLVGQITFKSNSVTRMTTTKQYDYLNRLTQISSTPSGTGILPVLFNYSYNSANQRIRNNLADGSYWIYGYDSLGQVTSGCKYFSDGTPVAGQQFDYTFDTIGNRTQTQTGGDQNGMNLRVANYTNNSLNQITSRDVPGYVDVKGVSIATNTVTVNGQTAYRKWEYFRAELPANNRSSALWTNITVAATGQTSVTGNVFLAKEPEKFSYDADGNLTQDGRWTYYWDTENRLINMTSLGTAPVGSRLKLDFAYDAKGRRIQKIVSTNNGSIYVPQSTNQFVYDGWNLIAEVTPNNSLIRSYVWGNDLSGSPQGAGGVGGLLEVSYYGTSTTNCFPAFDGNGNVMAYVSAADGTVVAQFDYDPFLNVTRATGPMAFLMPLLGSTKYYDWESGYYYYGYRYLKDGRWPNRDPLGERGGLNLYGFIGNNPVNQIDELGLMKWSDVVAKKNELEAQVSKIKCCCRTPGPNRALVTIAGTASGESVTETATVDKHGCTTIWSYYWWNCFRAQEEAWWIYPGYSDKWKEYGWENGGSSDTQSHEGKVPGGIRDSNHWNWTAAIIFTVCGADGYFHAIVTTSNESMWTWDPGTKSWTQ